MAMKSTKAVTLKRTHWLLPRRNTVEGSKTPEESEK
jgi:hypothetical protein